MTDFFSALISQLKQMALDIITSLYQVLWHYVSFVIWLNRAFHLHERTVSCYCESTVKVREYLTKQSCFSVKGDVDVLQCVCLFLWLVYGLFCKYIHIYPTDKMWTEKCWCVWDYVMFVCFFYYYFFNLNFWLILEHMCVIVWKWHFSIQWNVCFKAACECLLFIKSFAVYMWC